MAHILRERSSLCKPTPYGDEEGTAQTRKDRIRDTMGLNGQKLEKKEALTLSGGGEKYLPPQPLEKTPKKGETPQKQKSKLTKKKHAGKCKRPSKSRTLTAPGKWGGERAGTGRP